MFSGLNRTWDRNVSHQSPVSSKDIAERLGVVRAYALRLIKKRTAALGLKPSRGRRNELFLSSEDSDRLVEACGPRGTHKQSATGGVFYIVQLHPDDLPQRVKVGYTDNVLMRMADFRTGAPTLRLVGAWRCHRSWEPAAIASITRRCSHVGGEVYDGDIVVLTECADEFFALLPQPTGTNK